MIFSTNKYIKILSEIDNLLHMLGLHVLRKAEIRAVRFCASNLKKWAKSAAYGLNGKVMEKHYAITSNSCVLLESDSGITDTTLQHKIITLSLYSCSLELEVVLVFNTL